MAYSRLSERFYNGRQQIRTAWLSLWHFRPSRAYFLIWLLLQLLAWWQAIFIFRHLSGNVLVLHYNVNFGIDLVGDPMRIFIYPLYGLAVLLINLLIILMSHRRRDFSVFVHLLLAAALLFAIFINLVLMFVYLINFK